MQDAFWKSLFFKDFFRVQLLLFLGDGMVTKSLKSATIH